MIEKMVVGIYTHEVREATRDRLCAATGISEDDLFPLVGAKRDQSAS